MLKGDDPFFGLVDIPTDEFPAGAFTIFCATFGGGCNYYLSGLILDRFGWHNPTLQVWVSIGGIGLGIAFALRFIAWLVDREGR